MVLIIKNIRIEGPAKIGEYLDGAGIKTRILEGDSHDTLPKDPSGFSAIVVLGGPMNVDEVERFPFLHDECAFLAAALQKRIPVLGICLGAQLLARAAGAAVTKAAAPEIGWYDVALTDAGQKSPIFQNVPQTFPVFQWHGDTFSLPPGAHHLASSALCAHQAFAIDDFAFGLQFHFELNRDDIAVWVDAYIQDASKRAEMKASFDRTYGAHESAGRMFARTICANFFGRVQ